MIGYPYGFLSPGQFDVAVRFDVEDFGIHSVRAIPLHLVAREFGGYSGGFRGTVLYISCSSRRTNLMCTDGTWACLNPFRTFYGPVGGVRSILDVDRLHLRTIQNAVVVCINDSAWNMEIDETLLGTHIRSFDLGDVQPDLRGFSEAIKGK